jgi:dihydroorotase
MKARILSLLSPSRLASHVNPLQCSGIRPATFNPLHYEDESMSDTQRLVIDRPDDWHVHLRDGAALATTVPHSARHFGRAIVMPNLKPPVTSLELAIAYRDRIIAARPEGSDFDPLMTLYLTDNLEASAVAAAFDSGLVQAVKYYPAGATTNSDSGVSSMEKVMPVLERMAHIGMPLLIHGEVTDDEIDIFDREKVFIDTLLAPLCEQLPELKVVLEHITTRDSVEFVQQARPNVAATITAHHLLYNRNHLLAGGVRPHYYCLPILKRGSHQDALIAAATGGDAKFFLGTDSAPHARPTKETACGCAGIYTAPAAIEFYAEVFDAANALPMLEGFASHHGPDFYGLPRHTRKITLEKRAWQMPATFPFDGEELVPLRAGEQLAWQVLD